MGLLDETLGAIFVGVILSTALWGMSCIQTFNYFTSSPNDATWIKTLVAFVFVIDTVHQALVTNILYDYTVSHFGNLVYLLFVSKSLPAQLIIQQITATSVQGFFAYRIYRLSQRRLVIILPVVFLILLQFAAATVYTVATTRVQTYPQLDGLTGPALTYAVSVVSADTLIAVMLTWLLRKARNLSRAGRAGDPFAAQVDGVVHRLIALTMTTGMLASMCAIGVFASYIAITLGSTTFAYVPFFFMAGRLYFNSLMAALNMRPYVARRLRSHGTVAGARTAARAPARRPYAGALGKAEDGGVTELGQTSARPYSPGGADDDGGGGADYGASRADPRAFDRALEEDYGVDGLATAASATLHAPGPGPELWYPRKRRTLLQPNPPGLVLAGAGDSEPRTPSDAHTESPPRRARAPYAPAREREESPPRRVRAPYVPAQEESPSRARAPYPFEGADAFGWAAGDGTASASGTATGTGTAISTASMGSSAPLMRSAPAPPAAAAREAMPPPPPTPAPLTPRRGPGPRPRAPSRSRDERVSSERGHAAPAEHAYPPVPVLAAAPLEIPPPPLPKLEPLRLQTAFSPVSSGASSSPRGAGDSGGPSSGRGAGDSGGPSSVVRLLPPSPVAGPLRRTAPPLPAPPPPLVPVGPPPRTSNVRPPLDDGGRRPLPQAPGRR